MFPFSNLKGTSAPEKDRNHATGVQGNLAVNLDFYQNSKPSARVVIPERAEPWREGLETLALRRSLQEDPRLVASVLGSGPNPFGSVVHWIAVSEKLLLHLRVNGEPLEVAVPAHKTLLEVLREDLRLTGTKHGCELGECGTCTVLVDGEPVLSCLALPIELQETEILTVEGLMKDGRPHPLQVAFAEMGAAQCGYCTPGILLAAKALLDRNPLPEREEIQQALAGNLCRCTGYLQILQAIERAARGEVGSPISV